MGLKKDLRRLINRYLGLDIVKYSPGPSEVCWWITKYDIDLVLDVGANIGQFANSLFKMGYEGSVLSFEPLSREYEELLSRSRSNPKWMVAERCAIGDIDGEIEINISENSLGSSHLLPTQKLLMASPGSGFVGSEKVKMYKLSTIAPPFLKNFKSPFLKIDVQGFEDQVLKGATEILADIKGLEIELSFVPLYEGQTVCEDMLGKIRQLGFYLHDLKPFFEDEKGQILQAEAMFFKNGYTPVRHRSMAKRT